MKVMNPSSFVISISILIGIYAAVILGYLVFLFFGFNKKRHKDLDGRVITNPIFASVQNYWFTITEPFVSLLIKLKITPNKITMFGLLLGILAGVLYWNERWGTAGWVLIASGVFDLFDGRVARATKTVSKRGAFLDAVTDRYSDGAILTGLGLAFRDHWVLFFVLICFIGFNAISYAKARAEASGIRCDIGWFQRPVRILSLGIASIFAPIFNYYFSGSAAYILYCVIIFLGIGTIYASIQRVVYSFKRIN